MAEVHVGGDAGEVLRQAGQAHRADRAAALEGLDHEFVTDLCAEHVGQLGRHDHSVGRRRELVLLVVDRPAVHGVGIQAAKPDLPAGAVDVDGAPPRARAGSTLDHAGQAFELVLDPGRRGFDEADGEVLPLDDVPLVFDDLGDAGLQRVRQHEQAGGQGQPRDREERLHRAAAQVADGDAERVGEQAAEGAVRSMKDGR